MLRWSLFALCFVACRPAPGPVPTRCAASNADAAPFRLLSRAELDHTLNDLLGDSTHPAAAHLPAEPLVYGFDNNARLNRANDSWVAASFQLAEEVAARAVKERKSTLISACATEDADCGRRFVEKFGRRAFRRSLTTQEQEAFDSFFQAARVRDGFDLALEQTLTVFLQSPQFLYRPEVGLRAPLPLAPRSLGGAELASKLSYLLWTSMPDDELIAAAENGDLDDLKGLEEQARRLLASPKAQQARGEFFSRFFTLDALARVEKDAASYPAWTAALQSSWRRSMELYFGEIGRPGGTLTALLETPALYVDGTMTMYASTGSTEFQRVEMSSPGRRGVLAQPGLLARLASPDQGSPVRRGVFVFDRFLCQPLPPPPADIMATPPVPAPGSTTRERFATHSTPACATCHARIDPMGFGFEHFDGMGVWRDTEEGKGIDAHGAVVNPDDDSLAGPFNGVGELETKLAKSKQVHDCLAAQWYRWALGPVEAESDACALQQVQQRFFDSAGDFEALQLAIVGSDAFRLRSGVGP
jgi:hypothetical protein